MNMDNFMNGFFENFNDDFFQQFTNHGSFMRLNRHFLNEETLERIMELLSNQQRGMERSNINQIKKIKFRKNSSTKKGEEEKCSICLCEYEDNEELRLLPCEHLFHPTCVDTWLVQNSQCPVCKLDLNTNSYN